MPLTTEPRNLQVAGTEAALVRAAQAGDRAAFGKLYGQFARMIHGILLAHVSYADAKDLLQDVFLRAMQQIRGVREPDAFGGWLASVARHTAFDHHRRMRSQTNLATEIPGGKDRTAKHSRCSQ